MVKKGEPAAKYYEPAFAEKKVTVKNKFGKFRIFLDDGRKDKKGRTTAALDESITDLFPNIDKPDNEYKIGFSIDKNLIPTVHIKDASGAIAKTSLNRLLERIAIREAE